MASLLRKMNSRHIYENYVVEKVRRKVQLLWALYFLKHMPLKMYCAPLHMLTVKLIVNITGKSQLNSQTFLLSVIIKIAGYQYCSKYCRLSLVLQAPELLQALLQCQINSHCSLKVDYAPFLRVGVNHSTLLYSDNYPGP